MLKNLKFDKNNRALFKKNEINLLIHKYLYNSNYYIVDKNLTNLNLKNITKTKVKNFCIVSGRSRSVIPIYKISRIVLKRFYKSAI